MTSLPRPAGDQSLPASDHTLFQRLQAGFAEQYQSLFADAGAARTVLVVPSLSLDAEVLAKVAGYTHYEERMLCLLLLLRLPRTRVIFVTSQPVPPAIIDYYLQLLPGVPREHALRRLTLLACHDSSATALTDKILARPRLIERICAAIPDTACAHMTCFNVSDQERALAMRIGIPIYGCDPALQHFGSKTGSRQVFREAGLLLPDGFEDLTDAQGVAAALTDLKRRNPDLRRAVVKLNEGFSGEGNAIFRFDAAPAGSALAAWVQNQLPQLDFAAKDMAWEEFSQKIEQMGAIVETFVEGDVKRSPSVQFRIDPMGGLEVISTHDQIVDDRSGQIFQGCRFPADEAYRKDIQMDGVRAGEVLARNGVMGRFGIDFISVQEAGGWRNYAIEINLRKGGTTHPFQMLQFLTDGVYETETGLYRTRAGKACYYYASDNLCSPDYVGLLPEDLIEIAVENGLHFHGAQQEGVVFHLIGALSEFGKLGVLCVAGTPSEAEDLYRKTVAVLDREGRQSR